MVQLSDLLRVLPKGADHPEIVSNEHGLRYVDTKNDLFVSPALIEKKKVVSGNTSLILITAPAAVGKSTFAKELARQTGCPFWDLAGRRVGQNSFAGGILRSFRREEAADILSSLQRGEFLLVLDSLEESEQLSGEQNFEEFLNDICADLQTSRARPAIVILTRAETTLMTLYLEEHSVPYAHYALDFFSKNEACEFIDLRLDHLCKDEAQKLHRVHGNRFAEIRDEVFSLISRSIVHSVTDPWSSTETRRFVGYAPVLEAISEFLKVPNYQVFRNELQKFSSDVVDGSQLSVWTLLNSIVDGLLRREQEKCLKALRKKFANRPEVTDIDWISFYAPREQLVRIFGRVFGEDVGGLVTTSYPPNLQEEFEDTIFTWFEKHPFLVEGTGHFANKVFEEFFHAYIVAKEVNGLSDRVRTKLLGPEYLPNQMFGFLLLLFSDGDEQPTIHARDIGLLHDSMDSQATEETEVALEISGEGDGDQENPKVFGLVSFSGPTVRVVEFEIDNVVQGLLFTRRLANARIEFPGLIELGFTGRSFKLGPLVDLECRELLVVGDDVLAIADTDDKKDGDIIIRSGSCLYAPNLRVRKRGAGQLGVSWRPRVIPMSK